MFENRDIRYRTYIAIITSTQPTKKNLLITLEQPYTKEPKIMEALQHFFNVINKRFHSNIPRTENDLLTGLFCLRDKVKSSGRY